MVYVLGPCSIENYELLNTVASYLNPIMENSEWYLKASFDKANRSSLTSPRGPGLKESINIFKQIKANYPNIKLTTDVHEISQLQQLADIIDAIQIPAFLCRQTDLIVESAKLFNIVNIKKGQWESPVNMINASDKIKHTNANCKAWITERGSQFGYGKLLIDFSAVDILSIHFDKVLLDCTHSTQISTDYNTTSGNRELAKKYFKAAPIFNYSGIFAECHPNPLIAYSDKDSQIYLNDIKSLIK